MTISAETYVDDKRFLWGLCYRMTGSASEAEDLLQAITWVPCTVFTFWDKLRGTLDTTEYSEQCELGNGEPKYPQTWLRQFFKPVGRIGSPAVMQLK